VSLRPKFHSSPPNRSCTLHRYRPPAPQVLSISLLQSGLQRVIPLVGVGHRSLIPPEGAISSFKVGLPATNGPHSARCCRRSTVDRGRGYLLLVQPHRICQVRAVLANVADLEGSLMSKVC
jgi:hypothetical protein